MGEGRYRHVWRLSGLAVAFVVATAGVGIRWLRSGGMDSLRPGFAAYDRGGWDEASARATQRLKKAPADRDALRLLARASARLGRDSTAQNLYRRLGVQGAEAEDFFLLGMTLQHQGETSQALAMLERANAANPDHAETLFELIGLYAGQDRLAEATESATRLARLDGSSVRAAARLGLLYDDQNDPARAAASLERALRFDPQLSGSGLQAAEVLIRLARSAQGPQAGRGSFPPGVPPEVWSQSRGLLVAEPYGDPAGKS